MHLVKEALWRKGQLSWLLDKNQKELYEMFYKSEHRTQTWLLARRNGKSYTLCVLAIEQCLKKPNSIVKFLAPTRVQVNLVIRPLMRTLLSSCPIDLLPDFKGKDSIFYFPNGSELQLSGTDGGSAERLRGADSDLAIVDEAGSCTDLEYCVKDILLPTTLITKGKIILASTPPADTDHDFIKFIEQAEGRGSLVIKTIDDNIRITKEEKEKLIEEVGGIFSDSCQRELYCKVIKSSTKSVIPEFDDDKEKQIVRSTYLRPPFFATYVGMDIGFKDWTVVLFAFYDFINDVVVVEDEIVTYGKDMHLAKLGKEILLKENTLWCDPMTNEVNSPKKRVADHNLVAINELFKSTNYQLKFVPVKKEEKHSSINFLRNLVSGDKLVIMDHCKITIRHLKNAKWATNTERDTFTRCPEGSHYDAVDALAYLVKSIDFKNNPYPKGYNLTTRIEDMATYDERLGGVGYYKNPNSAESSKNLYRKLLNIKRR